MDVSLILTALKRLYIRLNDAHRNQALAPNNPVEHRSTFMTVMQNF